MLYGTELLNYMSFMHSVVLHEDKNSNFGRVPASECIFVQCQNKQTKKSNAANLFLISFFFFFFQIHWEKKKAVKKVILILKIE